MSDIFTNQEQTSPENKEAANLDPANEIVNALMEIKREDGSPKYTDPVEAIKALKTSQDHIRQIEADNASLREKADKVDTLEETLKRLGGNMNNNEKPNPQTQDEGGRSVEAAEELVAKILEKKLGERDAVNIAISNVKKVQDVLVARFGDKATEQINAKAKALGTTAQALKELSAQNPNLVLELFGSTSTTDRPNHSSVNLSGYKPPEEELKAPEKSLISGAGATSRNQVEYFNKIKERVNKRLGVTN